MLKVLFNDYFIKFFFILFIMTFVDLLKTTQNSKDLSVEHAISGIPPPPKNIRLRQADQRLHTLVSEFGQSTNLIEFLRGISYNFSMD